MAHPRPRLTPFSRLVLVQYMTEGDYSAARAAELMRISRATAYKWLRRFRTEGLPGLDDRSCRAHRLPHRLPASAEERVLAARRERRYGPHRLAVELGLPRSTIYRVLRRHGVSRLADFDPTHSVPVRYVRERPGELVHIDFKKLGRIPPGGGPRWVERPVGMQHRGANTLRPGFDFIHVAVDDATRLAFVQVLADDKGPNTARFLLDAAAFFASHDIRMERVLIDNAFTYRLNPRFTAAVSHLGARHKLTRPYRPQTNGKAERFIQILLREWAYAVPYSSNDERLAALPAWVDDYNRRRPTAGSPGLHQCKS